MAFAVGGRVEATLVDLDLVAFRHGVVEWIAGAGSGGADKYAGVVIAPRHPPLEPEHEIAKLCLGVEIEAITTGALEQRAVLAESGRHLRIERDKLPVGCGERERREGCLG